MFIRRSLLAVALMLNPIFAYAEKAPRGYEHLMSPHNHAFRYSEAGEPVRRGKRSERFELRDGDCQSTDCQNDRLRSEIREPKRRSSAKIDSDIWYGWSFLVAKSPKNPGRNGRLYPFFGQWKTGPNNSPTITFMQSDHGGKDVVFVSLSDMSRHNDGSVSGHKHGNVCKDIFSINTAKRDWVDIVVNTNFSTNSSGYIRVWVNGKLKCNYKGQIVASKPSYGYSGPNHRRGIYVGNTKRWKAKHGNAPVPTWIVFYDEFLVGASREDVDTRLREKSGFPPKD